MWCCLISEVVWLIFFVVFVKIFSVDEEDDKEGIGLGPSRSVDDGSQKAPRSASYHGTWIIQVGWSWCISNPTFLRSDGRWLKCRNRRSSLSSTTFPWTISYSICCCWINQSEIAYSHLIERTYRRNWIRKKREENKKKNNASRYHIWVKEK
jgi:hypothetical protein